MSVATLRPPASIYREEQPFAWWLYVLLALMVVGSWIGIALRPHAEAAAGAGAAGPASTVPMSMLFGLVLPPVLVLGVLRLTIEVTPVECRLWYGIIPTYRRSIPLDAIRSVEVIRYHAIRDHGFWGTLKTRDGERVFTARGDRAVRIHLADGSRILLGTQRPEELAAALDLAIRPQA